MARWHRFFARTGWPAPRRGQDRRRRRRCRGNHAPPAARCCRGHAAARPSVRASAAAAGPVTGLAGWAAARREGYAADAGLAAPAGLPVRAAARSLRCCGGAGGRERGAGRRRRGIGRPRRGAGGGAEYIAGAGAVTRCVAGACCVPGAGSIPGALGGLGLDLAHGFFQRQPLAGDLGFAERRLDAAQLRDQCGARPLIKRAAALAGSTGIQSGDGTGNQRVVISHFDSTMEAFRKHLIKPRMDFGPE